MVHTHIADSTNTHSHILLTTLSLLTPIHANITNILLRTHIHTHTRTCTHVLHTHPHPHTHPHTYTPPPTHPHLPIQDGSRQMA